MPLTIGSNIASFNAQRRLAGSTAQLQTSFERLSSGLRINRASDDAAGLAIADSLRADTRIINQGVRNLNDGISLLNIADSSVESLSTIIIRLEELAEQASNGTYGVQQRKALDTEAQALKKEFSRISLTTSFNGLGLLNGGLPSVNLQAGAGPGSTIAAGVGGAIGTGSFGSRTSFDTGISVSQLEPGDLNGDGIMDLVTFAYYATTVAFVSIGTGGGSFKSAVSYVGQGGDATALGDVNGDGVLDLVYGGGSTGVALGNGDGTFKAIRTSLGSSGSSMDLADVNADGILDVLGANLTFATVQLGAGNGTFGAVTSYAGSTSAVTAGDVNGDGMADLVSTGNIGGGRAYVRLGTGGGSFGAAVSYTMDTTVFDFSLEDTNGDSFLDIVTAGSSAGSGTAHVRLGSGTGTFGAAVSYTTESSLSYAVDIADANGDGLSDLVTGGEGSSVVAVTVRLGIGSGTFGAARSFVEPSASPLTMDMVMGDMNGDGVEDVVYSNYGYSTIRTAVTTAGVSPLSDFSLKSVADARQALPMFKLRRELLSKQRGEIGSFQSRIGVATNVLQAASENYQSAESRIRDVDIADESSRLTRLRILQQAGAAVLSQANQQPALALELLS